MASVVELRPDANAAERERELTGAIGMMVALGGCAMLFASVFFVYLGLRSHALRWPPPGLGPLPLALPAVNTVVIVASSVTLHRALARLRAGSRAGAITGVALTLALGCVFVALQCLLWWRLWGQGITTSTGALGAVLYALTALHLLHVVVGLAVLATLLAGAIRGAQLGRRVMTLRLCGMFWHFVGAVWILLFVGMFVL